MLTNYRYIFVGVLNYRALTASLTAAKKKINISMDEQSTIEGADHFKN